MGFSSPKGGKKTRSIRIRDRYIFNIFRKNAFWTKNSAFDFKKEKSILAFQIPALKINKKGMAASIYR